MTAAEREAKALAERYGYTVRVAFGLVYIWTKCEEWYFETQKDKIRLMHKSTRPQPRGEYHEQWKRYCTVEEIFRYVRDHERKLYGV